MVTHNLPRVEQRSNIKPTETPSNMRKRTMFTSPCFLLSPLLVILITLSTKGLNCQPTDKDEITRTECSPIPEEKSFHLDCPEDFKLIIREAYFSTSLAGNPQCSPSNYLHRTGITETCYEELRPQINARCSTVPKCTFNHTEVLSQCSGPGHLFLKYSCIAPYLLSHYCNTVVDRPYGYISSPTYPDYSASIDKCNWTIAATEGQSVELQVLDTQITEPRTVRQATLLTPVVLECTDALIITLDQKVISLCGETPANLQTIKAKGPSIKLSYRQNEFRATRGWLLRYQINGCPKLKDPFKGHIVEQDETSASITCCEGYIFRDTRSSKKQLTCLRNNWDGVISTCVRIADIDLPETSESSGSGDSELDNEIPTNPSFGSRLTKPMDETPKTLLSDLVFPISLTVLVIVVLVLFVILMVKCRSRRSKADLLTYTHEANVPLTNTSPVNV